MSRKKHKKQCNRKVNNPYTINLEQKFNKINKLIEDINNSLLPICNEIKEKQDILAQNFDFKNDYKFEPINLQELDTQEEDT